MDTGRERAVDRAHARWQNLVAEHEDPAREDATVRQLEAFVEDNSS
jgi:trimethylamine:corrinoid methyltransferase-like protein